jgi:hypothetical protein
LTAVGLGIFLLAQTAQAHTPFDASSRAIIHADAAEVSVTVGTALAEKFLRAAQLTPGQLPNGHPLALNPEVVTNFFAASADGNILHPRVGEVITDGVEYEFHFDYALAPAKTLRLESKFLPALNGSRTASLVLTDENGNILGSAILAPGKEVAEFSLPALSPPSPPSGERAGVRGTATNLPPEKNSVAATATNPTPSFTEFLKLGVGHILNVEAFDHLLFLLALLLGCRRLKPMLLVITGFTVAHSVTLTLAALNLANLSPRLVEPAIAASIIFVAAENFWRTDKAWHRYALTCGFGLIHGFGFASALRESGLGGTGTEIATPLLGFNVGVEIGQLIVAAIVLPLLLALNRWPWFARHGARVISALVIVVATFWLWERIQQQ